MFFFFFLSCSLLGDKSSLIPRCFSPILQPLTGHASLLLPSFYTFTSISTPITLVLCVFIASCTQLTLPEKVALQAASILTSFQCQLSSQIPTMHSPLVKHCPIGIPTQYCQAAFHSSNFFASFVFPKEVLTVSCTYQSL